MSDTWDRYEYLKALWLEFHGRLQPNEEIDERTEKLGCQLDKDKRWELIQLIDCLNLECETVSLESFISGSRLAMGIAKEVSYEAKFLEKD